MIYYEFFGCVHLCTCPAKLTYKQGWTLVDHRLLILFPIPALFQILIRHLGLRNEVEISFICFTLFSFLQGQTLNAKKGYWIKASAGASGSSHTSFRFFDFEDDFDFGLALLLRGVSIVLKDWYQSWRLMTSACSCASVNLYNQLSQTFSLQHIVKQRKKKEAGLCSLVYVFWR